MQGFIQNYWKVIRLYLICVIVSILVTLIVVAGSSELFVFHYMQINHIVYRRDLSDDLGFGLIGFLWSILSFCICFPISFLVSWKVLKKLKEDKALKKD